MDRNDARAVAIAVRVDGDESSRSVVARVAQRFEQAVDLDDGCMSRQEVVE